MTTLIQFLQDYWRALVEILILAVAIYYIFNFFRGTRGWAVFTGFLVVLLSLAILVNFLDLKPHVGFCLCNAKFLLISPESVLRKSR